MKRLKLMENPPLPAFGWGGGGGAFGGGGLSTDGFATGGGGVQMAHPPRIIEMAIEKRIIATIAKKILIERTCHLFISIGLLLCNVPVGTRLTEN